MEVTRFGQVRWLVGSWQKKVISEEDGCWVGLVFWAYILLRMSLAACNYSEIHNWFYQHRKRV
jgi:hypothetical protein